MPERPPSRCRNRTHAGTKPSCLPCARGHECGSRPARRDAPACRHKRALGACRFLANSLVEALVSTRSRSRSQRRPDHRQRDQACPAAIAPKEASGSWPATGLRWPRGGTAPGQTQTAALTNIRHFRLLRNGLIRLLLPAGSSSSATPSCFCSPTSISIWIPAVLLRADSGTRAAGRVCMAERTCAADSSSLFRPEPRRAPLWRPRAKAERLHRCGQRRWIVVSGH